MRKDEITADEREVFEEAADIATDSCDSQIAELIAHILFNADQEIIKPVLILYAKKFFDLYSDPFIADELEADLWYATEMFKAISSHAAAISAEMDSVYLEWEKRADKESVEDGRGTKWNWTKGKSAEQLAAARMEQQKKVCQIEQSLIVPTMELANIKS